MSILNTLVSRLTPSFITNGYFALKRFFLGSAPATEVATDFVADTAKNTAMEMGKMAVAGAITTAVPGAHFAAQAVTTIATNGVNAAISGDNLGRALVKGGMYALNTAAVGPLCAMPLNIATDYAVDKVADLYDVGFVTAYNNYKNCEEWEALKYCKHQGPSYDCTRIVDEDLNASFMLLSPQRTAAAAA
ncbi:hypothetical protein CC99x_010440 [Candidatus Berkiella cookevillensis]|uniref:Uncharacterized protein n=1 Tax=Candidatus Berkiella cookevillensis TaxID=437022 RepID=A0A0Q9YEN7_9GAMM|nr:hypothetical protein [Candidatus Berkiella cookevillensis]MCS5709323.1 hypothetical protein [Candidatus Berkiella cookevillensis]